MVSKPHLVEPTYIDATLAGTFSDSNKSCPLCKTRKPGRRIAYSLWSNSIHYVVGGLCLDCSNRIEGNRARGEEPLEGFYEN